jgi:tRNA pseudouridine38-40 synthase
MEHYYKIKVSYKGTHYFGWQVQKEGRGKTIQGQINKALYKIFKSDKVKTVGSGRTDAGVHAFGQILKVSAPFCIKASSLVLALNSLLPLDINILEVEECSGRFHPIHSAVAKQYLYLFSNEWPPNPFFYEKITFLKGDMSVTKMKEASTLFVGLHNFKNFYCEGTPVTSYEREIFECALSEKSMLYHPLDSDPHKQFILSVKGSGFLKQMVRLIMGAIWEVGKGKLQLEDLEKAISNKVTGKVGPVAPPQGLYLNKVFYS